jgi:hypothetical protein
MSEENDKKSVGSLPDEDSAKSGPSVGSLPGEASAKSGQSQPPSTAEGLPQSQQPQTINLSAEQAGDKPETSTMEVHHHPHVENKNFKEYLLEGLMIFLAVTLGFFAESLREHIIEGKSEEKYAQTLYEDLKVDTALLNAAIREKNFVIPKIDTFRMMVHTKAIDEFPSGTWAYFGRFGTRKVNVSLQDATLQQLLSSGGLRLFKKNNVAYTIAQYNQAVQDMHDAFPLLDLVYSDLIKARNKIFDAWYLDEIMELTVSAQKIDSFKKKSFLLLSNKKEDFIQYANLCQLQSFNLKLVLLRIEMVDKRAEVLLTLLKKEYQLK